MVDLHSHLLPGIDDGAPDSGASQKILQQLLACGVTRVALTPHFYPAKNSVSNFLAARREAYERLLVLPESREFRFLLGAEVYLTESLFNARDLEALCLEGTGLMLVEPAEREGLTQGLVERLERLVSFYDLTPVVAHIDRFPYLFRNRKALNRLRELGCLFQMNVSGALEWGKKRACRRLLREGQVDFLGNDLHRPTDAPAFLARRLEKLEKGVGVESLRRIEEGSLALFGNWEA